MKTVLFFLVLGAVLHAEEPRIIFDNRPESGIPLEAQKQEAGGGARSHGTLAELLGDSVRTVNVRYFSNVWSDQKQVSAYLTGLLSDDRTETYTFQIWSQRVGVPDIECLLTFKNDQPSGRLLVWGTEACVRDASGKWWFVPIFDYFHSKHPKGDRSLVRKAPQPK